MTFGPIKTRKYEEMTPTRAELRPQLRECSSEQNSRSSIPAVSPKTAVSEKTPSRTKTPEPHHHQDGTTTSSPEEDIAATPTLQRPAQDRTRPAPPARLGRSSPQPPPPDEDLRTPDPPLARHRRRSQPLKTPRGKRASRRRTPAPEHAAASTPRIERRAPNHLSARSRRHCCVVVWIDSND